MSGEGLLRRCAAGLGVEPRATLSIWVWRLFVLPQSQARQWPLPLRDNLLGMSFLSRLHRWEFANGKLVLEQ